MKAFPSTQLDCMKTPEKPPEIDKTGVNSEAYVVYFLFPQFKCLFSLSFKMKHWELDMQAAFKLFQYISTSQPA